MHARGVRIGVHGSSQGGACCEETENDRERKRARESKERVGGRLGFSVIAKIDVSLKKLFLRTEIIGYRHCQVWVSVCMFTRARERERRKEKERRPE